MCVETTKEPRPQTLVDYPLSELAQGKGTLKRPFDGAGEDVSGKTFLPRSNLCSCCNSLWPVPGPPLDFQARLPSGVLGRVE